MATFRYVLEREGAFYTDTVDARNRREAEAVVQRSSGGRPAAWMKELNVDLPDAGKKKISLLDQLSMWRVLAASAKGGLTAMQAIDVAAKTMPKPKQKAAIRYVYDACVSGVDIASAFAAVPNIADPVAVGLIDAGAAAGSAQKGFEQVRRHVQSRYEIRRAIMRAMVYPMIVLPAAAALVFFLVGWVLPTFDEIFKDLNAKLPVITENLMKLGRFVQGNTALSVLMLGGIVTTFWGFPPLVMKPWLVRPGTSEKRLRWPVLHRWMLRLPIFGPIVRLSLEASMVRTLVTLGEAGIEMPLRLRLCRTLSWNLEFAAAMARIYEFVVGGRGPLSVALRNEPHLFTPLWMGIAEAAEAGSNPDELLKPYADTVEELVQDRVKALEKGMEPLLIILLACIVLPIVLAVFLPLFNMPELIGKS